MANEKEYVNPAQEALKKKNPFAEGTFDGTTNISQRVVGQEENPNSGLINIIDGEEYEVPANQKIIVPDREKQNEYVEVDNKSRGKVGFVSNPDKIKEMQAAGIPVNDNKPLSPSVEEMQKRFDDNARNDANKIRIREEKSKKMRCKMQKAPYNPPEDLKDIPALAPYDPNKDDVQEEIPDANTELGEVILTDDTDNDLVQKSQGQNNAPAIEDADTDTDNDPSTSTESTNQ